MEKSPENPFEQKDYIPEQNSALPSCLVSILNDEGQFVPYVVHSAKNLDTGILGLVRG